MDGLGGSQKWLGTTGMDRSMDLYGVWFTALLAASTSFMGHKSDIYYSFIESYVQVKGELMHNDRATNVKVMF